MTSEHKYTVRVTFLLRLLTFTLNNDKCRDKILHDVPVLAMLGYDGNGLQASRLRNNYLTARTQRGSAEGKSIVACGAENTRYASLPEIWHIAACRQQVEHPAIVNTMANAAEAEKVLLEVA